MTGWTALIPFKADASAKSRLAEMLSHEERRALSVQYLEHVVSILDRSPAIERIILLSPERPKKWGHEWHVDEGKGLNAELQNWRDANPADNLLIIHTDLPLLGETDVAAILSSAAHTGVAMATDRHGTGTNALALHSSEEMTFHFGLNSRSFHETECPGIVVISRPGLSTDIDTPDDLSLLRSKDAA